MRKFDAVTNKVTIKTQLNIAIILKVSNAIAAPGNREQNNTEPLSQSASLMQNKQCCLCRCIIPPE